MLAELLKNTPQQKKDWNEYIKENPWKVIIHMLLKTESDSLIGVIEFSERHGFVKIDKNLWRKVVYEVYNMGHIILY